MNVASLQQTEYKNAYGIFCATVSSGNGRDGVYPTFCRIPLGGATEPHAHFESEVFFIVEGSGQMRIQDESTQVVSGDLVRIPPFARHELKNTGSSELVFLSIYSEDFEVSRLPASAIVTAAPPTPNGPLHLGHISGPYLAADVLSRYLRLRSSKILSHSGSDDHQNYVTELFREQMRSRIQVGLRNMDIRFDEFIEPKKDREYQLKVFQFAKKAVAAKVIELEHIEFPFCAHCKLYLVDALIEGTCPKCEQSSRGGCESCGIVVAPQELHNPRCARCQLPATKKSTEVYQFSLSKHLPLIRKDLDALRLPPRLRSLVQSISAVRDLKVLVSHPDSVGQSLTMPGSNQALHVWFEMAAHYEEFALDPRFWIHCFGFDNAFHYLLFIPTLLRALNPNAKLPDAVVANEFLTLDGLKFSTSRNHAIWADEVQANADHLRFFLSLYRPAPAESNFSAEEFRHFSMNLGARLENLQARAGLLSKAAKSEVSSDVLIACNRVTRELELLLSPASFDLRRASRRIFDFIDEVEQAYETGGNERLMLQVLATLLTPIMPTESAKLFQSLELIQRDWMTDWARAV